MFDVIIIYYSFTLFIFILSYSCWPVRAEIKIYIMYRKQNAEFWIALFHQIQSEGHFSGDLIDKELSRFCFTDLIQGNKF